MKALVIVLVAFGARAEWKPPTVPEAVFYGVGQGLIVLDLMTSLDIKNHPCGTALAPIRPCSTESNWLLGAHPSNTKLYLGTAAALLTNTLVWYKLPSPWRDYESAVVVGVEGAVVFGNFYVGLKVRLN